MSKSASFSFDKEIKSINTSDYKNSCVINIEFEPKPIILTDFQELIVNCKPEINKPVFILSGAGSGKTTAIEERSKYIKSAYVSVIPKMFYDNRRLNVVNIDNLYGYEEYIYEIIFDVEFILEVSKYKKVIGFCTPIDFIKKIGPKLKGEYTIISGFNLYDNPYIRNNNPSYEKLLNELPPKDRDRYMGNWKYEY